MIDKVGSGGTRGLRKVFCLALCGGAPLSPRSRQGVCGLPLGVEAQPLREDAFFVFVPFACVASGCSVAQPTCSVPTHQARVLRWPSAPAKQRHPKSRLVPQPQVGWPWPAALLHRQRHVLARIALAR